MDEKDYLFKLSQIAKWYTPIISETSGKFRRPYGGQHPSQVNPTLGPIIDQLIVEPRPCEWCGRQINQRVSWTKPLISSRMRTRISKWIGKCNNCNLYRDLQGRLTTRDPRK